VATHGVFVALRVSCGQVLSHLRCIIHSNLCDTLRMGDGLITESKYSNYTFIMLSMIHEMDVDYLVVHELINIKNCLVTIACLV
jgi:hypothetical protein